MLIRATTTALFSLTLLYPVAAQAQVSWVNGQPIFHSDRRAAQNRSVQPRRQYSTRFPKYMTGGGRPYIQAQAPGVVSFPNKYGRGTVVIDTRARKLYYTVSSTTAYQYPISVGRRGFKWYGTQKVSQIKSWPSWTPPAEMRQRQPYLPVTMSGGIRNPLGAKAIYLGSTLYRIHGTNDARTIGQDASSGCFRMMNKHVLHLARLVKVGTPVHVKRSVRGGVAGKRSSGSAG